MKHNYDPDLEYFLGISLPKKDSLLFEEIRKTLEQTQQLSSPPHITVKPPFIYHFEVAIVEQLTKWANQQTPFIAKFKKIATFKHEKYGTVFLAPDSAQNFKRLDQSLSQAIRFLPENTNFIPHLTLANRIPLEKVAKVKDQARALNISLKLKVDNLTLFEHHRGEPWTVKKVFNFPNP